MSTYTIPSDLIGLELYEQDAKFCSVFDRCLAVWRNTYPRLDVLFEIKKAHAWEVCNPRLRKTDRQRYINNWLSRASDKLPAVKQPVNQMSKVSSCERCRMTPGWVEEQFVHERYGSTSRLTPCSHKL